MTELEEMLGRGNNEGFTRKANGLVKSIREQMQKILVRFQVDTPQGVPTSPIVFIWNVAALLTGLPLIPDLDTEIKALSFLRDIIPGRGFKAIYRTLIQDITTTQRLGAYHDIITSRVSLAEDSRYTNWKVEEMQYYRKKSWWRIPM